MMHQLLWTNLLESGVRAGLTAIPWLGQILTAFPPLMSIILYFISKYIEYPVFLMLTRFGVFTSIDWHEEAIYREYEKQAIKLIPLQEKETWDEADEKAFTDAARSLIRFNLKLQQG